MYGTYHSPVSLKRLFSGVCCITTISRHGLLQLPQMHAYSSLYAVFATTCRFLQAKNLVSLRSRLLTAFAHRPCRLAASVRRLQPVTVGDRRMIPWSNCLIPLTVGIWPLPIPSSHHSKARCIYLCDNTGTDTACWHVGMLAFQ